MVQINLALKEINCKIVYFGCGLGGKTTNLEVVHDRAGVNSKGELTSIATESDRTLFFDFMPLDLGEVSGMRVKFQLYTVPGQVYYNSTRKLVLRGADAVIFIADSQPSKRQENIDSLNNLEECLQEQGRSLADTPHVIQFNKCDMPNSRPAAQMEQELNKYSVATFSAVASTGEGVLETFKAMANVLLDRVRTSVDEVDAQARREPVLSAANTAAPSRRQRLEGGLSTPTPIGVPVSPARTHHKAENRSLDTSTAGVPAVNMAPAPTPTTPRRDNPSMASSRIASPKAAPTSLIVSTSRSKPTGTSWATLAAIGLIVAAIGLAFFLL